MLDGDPFVDSDEALDLGALISCTMGNTDQCSVEEYITLFQFALT